MVEPTSTSELAEVIRSSKAVRIEGGNTKFAWRIPSADQDDWTEQNLFRDREGRLVHAAARAEYQAIQERREMRSAAAGAKPQTLSLAGLNGVVDYSPSDQVVTFRAGISLAEAQSVLQEYGQCLPVFSGTDTAFSTVGGCLAMNLPHLAEGRAGNWRDWVLRMTVVLADGTVATCGSRVVKNVAGYDVHKFVVGSRGTLAVVADATLRTWPSASPPTPRDIAPEELALCNWIQRVPRNQFEHALTAAGEQLVYGDALTCTLYAAVQGGPDRAPFQNSLPRYDGDWVLRAGAGHYNFQFSNSSLSLMRRAKEVFDPVGKLNPGEMGIF